MRKTKLSWRIILSFSLIFILIFLVGIIHAGIQCKFGSHKGSVSGTTINLGTIVRADISSGKSTEIRFPHYFQHDGGTWDYNHIKTNHGDFVLKLKAKLAGNKKWYWSSKTNTVKVKLYKGSQSEGDFIEEKSIQKSVGSPKDYSLEFSQVTGDQNMGETRTYWLRFYCGKSDGYKGNDGHCWQSFKVIRK